MKNEMPTLLLIAFRAFEAMCVPPFKLLEWESVTIAVAFPLQLPEKRFEYPYQHLLVSKSSSLHLRFFVPWIQCPKAQTEVKTLFHILHCLAGSLFNALTPSSRWSCLVTCHTSTSGFCVVKLTFLFLMWEDLGCVITAISLPRLMEQREKAVFP